MLIYLCLSSHGFGHASRQAAIFEQIYKIKPNCKLVVSSNIDHNYLKSIFKDIPVVFRDIRWDVGVFQENAFDIDLKKTLRDIHLLDEYLTRAIELEVSWIKKQKLPVLIVGDIPPSAANLASRLGCKLIWVGNFGWDQIYKPLGPEFRYQSDKAYENYVKGDLLIKLPFALKMDWSIEELNVGITIPNSREVPCRFLDLIPRSKNSNVFVGFGGLGYKLNPDLFNLWPDYKFILPKFLYERSKFRQSLPNVISLPHFIRPFDVLNYCSRIITKPGYSTLCESLASSVGIHLVERKDFIESKALKKGTKSYSYHRFLSEESLISGNWELNHSLIRPLENGGLSRNGSYEAAIKIASYLD